MKNDLRFLLLNAAIAAFCSSLICASEVALPAAQIESGKCSFFVLNSFSSEKLNFKVESRDEIKVGNNSYFSQVTNDLESDGAMNAVLAKLVINPDNGLYYWLKAGIGAYNLEIPSLNAKNKLSGQDKGWLCGFGARKLLFPDTLVSPAIAFDLGITRAEYGIDTFRSGSSAPVAVSNRLDITELQAGFVVSKKIKRVEPYGGLKVYRKTVMLSDKTGFSNVSGTKDGAGVFLGVRLNFHRYEALVIEGSLGGDTDFSVGLNIGL
jgi:hypothetical protein